MLDLHYREIQQIKEGWLPDLNMNCEELVELYSQVGSKRFFETIALDPAGHKFGADLLQKYLDVHVNPPKWVEKKLADQMTVGKLIEKLQQYDPDTIVGNSGHFGELLEFSDCSPGKAYICQEGDWRREIRYEIPVIDISIQDAGPDPC